MAVTEEQVSFLRSAMRDVEDLAIAELQVIWGSLPLDGNPRAVRDGLIDELPDVIESHYLVAAAVTADWYDTVRLEAETPRRFQAVIPDLPPDDTSPKLAWWGVAPLFGRRPSSVSALSKLAGGLQRVVLNGSRQTITVSSLRDPVQPGWTRVGEGGCDYCRKRIGVHRTTEDFGAHDSCHCQAVPDL